MEKVRKKEGGKEERWKERRKLEGRKRRKEE